MTASLKRTYRCPQCGYDGFRSGAVKAPIDVNVMYGCPQCQTLHGVTVWLKETSDPRDEAA